MSLMKLVRNKLGRVECTRSWLMRSRLTNSNLAGSRVDNTFTFRLSPGFRFFNSESVRGKLFIFLLLSALLALSNGFEKGNAIAFAERNADEAESLTTVGILYRGDDGLDSEPSFRCTGSIINATQILTAAHCVHKLRASNLLVTAPGSDVMNSYIDVQQVVDYIEHPGYSDINRSFGVNDIAIIEMRGSFTNYTAVKFARPNLEKRILKSNLFLLGYGSNENGEITGALMRSRQGDYTSKALKFSKYFDPTTQIAAALYSSSDSSFSGACPGDSGGPLMSKTTKGFYQLGIVSYGAQDCTTATPTFYMRVSYYLDWMMEASNNLKARKSGTSVIFSRDDSANDVGGESLNDLVKGSVKITGSKLSVEAVYNPNVRNPSNLLINMDLDGDGVSEYRVNEGVLSNRSGGVICNGEKAVNQDQGGSLVVGLTFDLSCFSGVKMIDLYILSPYTNSNCAVFEVRGCYVSGRDDRMDFVAIIIK